MLLLSVGTWPGTLNTRVRGYRPLNGMGIYAATVPASAPSGTSRHDIHVANVNTLPRDFPGMLTVNLDILCPHKLR